VRVTINIELVRVGLVISIDREHGTGVNHIVSVAATNPGIQVCYLYCCVCQCTINKNTVILVICV
jgi:hypothetical protein